MPAYLDYAASTPLDPRVGEAMRQTEKIIGNPSATHSFGRAARQAVDKARDEVSACLGVDPSETVFTSGATEANNAAVLGVLGALAKRHPGRKFHALVSPLEHASVLSAFDRAAELYGIGVEKLPLDGRGIVREEAVAAMIRPDTVMVACISVNNVLGSVQPIVGLRAAVDAAIAQRGEGGLPLRLFTDAVQAAARLDMRPIAAAADILTVSAHKMYGPKGVGALVLKKGVPFSPMLVGGGQEEGRRSGTENPVGIVGFGQACEFIAAEREEEAGRARSQAEKISFSLGNLSGLRILGTEAAVPGIVFLQSDRFDGENLALRLDAAGFAVSTGSACDAGHRRAPAAVMAAFGERAASRGGIRVSWGRFTEDGDLDAFVEELRRLHS